MISSTPLRWPPTLVWWFFFFTPPSAGEGWRLPPGRQRRAARWRSAADWLILSIMWLCTGFNMGKKNLTLRRETLFFSFPPLHGNTLPTRQPIRWRAVQQGRDLGEAVLRFTVSASAMIKTKQNKTKTVRGVNLLTTSNKRRRRRFNPSQLHHNTFTPNIFFPLLTHTWWNITRHKDSVWKTLRCVPCVHMCAWADRSKALHGEDEIYNDGVMSLNADLMAKHWTAAFLQLNYDTLSLTTIKHKVESLIHQVSWRFILISWAALMQEKKMSFF